MNVLFHKNMGMLLVVVGLCLPQAEAQVSCEEIRDISSASWKANQGEGGPLFSPSEEFTDKFHSVFTAAKDCPTYQFSPVESKEGQVWQLSVPCEKLKKDVFIVGFDAKRGVNCKWSLKKEDACKDFNAE